MHDNMTEFTALIIAATIGAKLHPLTINEFEDHFQNDNSNVVDDSNGHNGNKEIPESAAQSKAKEEITYLPKHLLPLAGRPILLHLIEKLIHANMNEIIITISQDDNLTVSSLVDLTGATIKDERRVVTILQLGNTQLKIVQLPSDCFGSADALRFVSAVKIDSGDTSNDHDDKKDNADDNKDDTASNYQNNSIIPQGSHVVVMPGDLILYGNLSHDNSNHASVEERKEDDILAALLDEHRRNYRLGVIGEGQPLALTMALTDVGETENGIPLKESAKAKKGGISREEGEIEYIALSEIPKSSPSSSSRIATNAAKCLVMKQQKLVVEEDEDNTGQTPKLYIPKARLHAPIHQMLISTEWNDIHLFCLSPWVLKLIETKIHMKDLAKEIVPLLVASQFKGVKACLGLNQNSMESEDIDTDDTQNLQVLEQILSDIHPEYSKQYSKENNTNQTNNGDNEQTQKCAANSDYPFTVLAYTSSHQSSKLILRACNVQSYSYACREVVTQAIKKSTAQSKNLAITLPEGAAVDTKSNSIILTSGLSEKVKIQSSTIGKNVIIGKQCRLNNVVIMDDVTIGDNCSFQNSVVSKGCSIGSSCSLNDCKVGPYCILPKNTKGKGEDYPLAVVSY